MVYLFFSFQFKGAEYSFPKHHVLSPGHNVYSHGRNTRIAIIRVLLATDVGYTLAWNFACVSGFAGISTHISSSRGNLLSSHSRELSKLPLDDSLQEPVAVALS